ncbi:MAG TPA: chromosome segregation protein SMC [Agitococcus sp.]|nr:chromosome segregation protein SMC [Agitococcus sp.]
MRLKSIKLAGFKSFVDATTVPFPTNLSAIVGPNGCGKSNIIDAVRWVMGESSARYLRGESMADVIFNGSSGRKPVGQASIELIFDNSDGTLGGEYARYNEIAVRRQVNRDGKSDYFLNSSRCRRKDITDIFLGTGLGPRSYAIIEQGMISRLIEARPEELRVYIEEAAGISRYKERRKETETRLTNTRDNLARLNDIRDELTRQLSHLQKQADAAEKYRALKTEERQTKIELFAWRWQTIQQELAQYELQIQQQAEQLAQSLDQQQHLEAALVLERQKEEQAHQDLHGAQNHVYGVANSINQNQQQIAHLQQRRQQLLQQQQSVVLRQQQAQQESVQDAEEWAMLDAQLNELKPVLDELHALLAEQNSQLFDAEQNLLQQQQAYEIKQQQIAQSTSQVQVWQAKVQAYEQALLRSQERQQRLQKELAEFATDGLLDDVAMQQEALAELDVLLQDEQAELEQLSDKLTQAAQQSQQLQQNLHKLKSEQQKAEGQQSALQALQQAAVGRDNQQQYRWLQQQGLAEQPRLAEVLKVEQGFEPLVETVLADVLKAIVVDDISQIDVSQSPALVLIERGANTALKQGSLAQNLVSEIAQDLLTQVYAVADLPTALAQRQQLANGESIITEDGYCVGKTWLKVLGKGEDSVLARQHSLEALQQQLAHLHQEISEAQQQQVQLNQLQQHMEQQRLQAQRQLSSHLQQRGAEQAKLAKLQAQLTQTQLQAQRLRQELEELAEQRELDQESLAESRMQLEQHLQDLQEQQLLIEDLQQARENNRVLLNNARFSVQQTQQQNHQTALKVQGLETRLAALSQNKQRQQHYLMSLDQQTVDMQRDIEALIEPVAELKLVLEELMAEKLIAEQTLQQMEQDLHSVTQYYRQLEQQRQTLVMSLEPLRQQLEKNRLQWQNLSAHQGHIVEQLKEFNINTEIIANYLNVQMNESEWQMRLEQLANKISRLGAINLAAIDEYQQQAERKQYLDNQAQDLEEALTKLEAAIKHIDKETRSLFIDTYNRVNEGLQHLFPKVFGGGMASLSLVGEDTLTSGVSIMARPPGKKNATIHLLSGGEKALTALALVFSIFQLNPAPFCLLDEVDAPLDDANVGRFCRLVEEMAQQVQFIYITHNKIAMSMATQLMGVTMHEPGVSRLVTVNVEQAAALAAA